MSRVPEPEAMQVGRLHVSPEERSSRVKGKLCFYCGQSIHFIGSCYVHPPKGGGLTVVREVLLNETTTSSPQTHPHPDAAIIWHNHPYPTLFLLTDECFIDKGICSRLGIGTEPLKVPVETKDLNGLLLARVDNQTVLVLVRLGRDEYGSLNNTNKSS